MRETNLETKARSLRGRCRQEVDKMEEEVEEKKLIKKRVEMKILTKRKRNGGN